MDKLRIGKVATRSGVSVDTVRYYEERGLIAEPARLASGYRQFAPEVIERIRFIKQAQELGFTLSDVEQLIELRDSPDATCADVRRQAESKLAEIEEKLNALRRITQTLDELVSACNQPRARAVEACPIIDAMEDNREG